MSTTSLNILDRDSLINAIRLSLSGLTLKRPQNQAILQVASEISKLTRAQDRKIKALNSQIDTLNAQLSNNTKNNDDLPDGIKAALATLSADSTDEELRTGARAILIHRIKTDNIKGADLGKFVELLGIGSKDEGVEFQSVEFSELIGLAHPLPGLSLAQRADLRDLIQERSRGTDWDAVLGGFESSAGAGQFPKGAGGQSGGTVGNTNGEEDVV